MATSILSQPHDRFFKETFSRREVVEDCLRNILPDKMVEYLDFETLEVCKESFIDASLQNHFSDLLYKIKRKDDSDVHLYILFEHKSYPEPWTAFHLIRYM
ncbi:MAG: transposase, partial [Candidatus Omnitrophota bacterium]